jgi:hypothetical protein
MEAADAPTAVEYVPATQAEQFVDPSPLWKYPAEHSMQLPRELDPVLHEKVPALQLSHTAAPAAVWYFPASHGAHAHESV